MMIAKEKKQNPLKKTDEEIRRETQKIQEELEVKKNKKIQYLVQTHPLTKNYLKQLVENDIFYNRIITAISLTQMTPQNLTISEIKKYTNYDRVKISRCFDKLMSWGLLSRSIISKEFTYSIINFPLFEELVYIAEHNQFKFIAKTE